MEKKTSTLAHARAHSHIRPFAHPHMDTHTFTNQQMLILTHTHFYTLMLTHTPIHIHVQSHTLPLAHSKVKVGIKRWVVARKGEREGEREKEREREASLAVIAILSALKNEQKRFHC